MASKKIVNEIIVMIKQNFSSSDILKTLREEGYSPMEIREGIDQAQTKLELARAAGDESLAMEDFEESVEETPRPQMKMTKSIMGTEEEEEKKDRTIGEERIERTEPKLPVRRQYSETRQEESSPEIGMAPAPGGGGFAYPSQAYSQQQAYSPQQTSYSYSPISVKEEEIDEMVEEIVNDKIREIEAKIGNIDSFRQNIEKQIKGVDADVVKMNGKMQSMNSDILEKIQELTMELRSINAEVMSLENAFLKILSPLVSNMKDINRIANEANKIEFKKVKNIEEINEKISEQTKKIESKIPKSKKKESERETLDKLIKLRK